MPAPKGLVHSGVIRILPWFLLVFCWFHFPRETFCTFAMIWGSGVKREPPLNFLQMTPHLS